MKNFTKILAVVIALTFVLTSAAVGIFAGTETAWYQAAINYLDSNKITSIGEKGDEPVTRDEFVTWAAKIESHQLVESAWNSHKYETVATSTFTDVSDSDHKGAIGYAVNREFINGYGDGTFGPHNVVKLAEACAVIVRMMGYQDLVDTSDWAYSYMHVANVATDCMDSAFLEATGTIDPDYELTKGEAAWLLYKAMNGVYHVAGYTDNEYKVLVNTNKIHLTNLGVDLGAWFYSSDSVNTTIKLVVTNLPLHYKSDYYYSGNNSTMIDTPLYSNSSGNYASFFRYDALTSGAKYDSLLNYKVLKTDGRIDEKDPDAIVTLTNIQNGDVYTLTVAEFCSLVRKAIGTTDTTVNLSLAVELGSAITVKCISKDYRKYVDGVATFAEVIDSFAIANSVVADTYIGTTAETTANDANGLTAVGWTSYSAAAASSSTLRRVSDNATNWDGDKLLVNGDAYSVVTSYTGAAKELKVFAPTG
ncbi:MAG: S-layer homology domain-containing protein, partial [Clostridia bacterium]|nr:S-layer homology domain-containing protein [Clostridia bacterium]